MATTPTTPTTTTATTTKKGIVATLWTDITNWLAEFPGVAFVKAHEKLIIVIILALVACHFWNSAVSAWDRHEDRQLTTLQQQLSDTKTQVTQSQAAAAAAASDAASTKAAAAQQQAANAAIIASLSAQNTELNKEIAQRQQTTQQQQTTDLTASLPDLSKRLLALVPNVNPADVTIAPDGSTATIGKDTAEKTIAQLELVPSLQADKANLQTEISNLNTELASAQKTIDMTNQYADAEAKYAAVEAQTITLLNTELAQADKVCDQKVAQEKQNAKKSFWKGTKVGIVIGTIGTIVAKVLITVK